MIGSADAPHIALKASGPTRAFGFIVPQTLLAAKHFTSLGDPNSFRIAFFCHSCCHLDVDIKQGLF